MRSRTTPSSNIVWHGLHTDEFLPKHIVSKWDFGFWFQLRRDRWFEDEEYRRLQTVSYHLQIVGQERAVEFKYRSYAPRNRHI